MRLKAACEFVEVPDRAWEALWERRVRSHRRHRIAALAVALIVGAGSIGGMAVLLTGLDAGPGLGAGGWEPSRRLELRSGEFFYVRVTSDEAEDGHIRDEETWWAPDGSGEVRNRSSRQDKYPYPPTGRYEAGMFPSWLHGVSSLSTDPSVLATQLGGASYDWEMLLLEAPYATPELRAAVFEVASGLDGVTVVKDARDPSGRPSIALERSERDGGDVSTWRMYFDAGTRQAIAWTFESSRGGSAWILLESGIVDDVGARPVGDQWLVPPVSTTPE